ncbi:hypothetical protein F4678DRAFT_442316 [Xylaria arbuscula]|nr:hypothetical protein F4678DRAFT_442316 [Xylaria arbuscula]
MLCYATYLGMLCWYYACGADDVAGVGVMRYVHWCWRCICAVYAYVRCTCASESRLASRLAPRPVSFRLFS